MFGPKHTVVIAVQCHAADRRAVGAPAEVRRQVGKALFSCPEQDERDIQTAKSLPAEGAPSKVLEEQAA